MKYLAALLAIVAVLLVVTNGQPHNRPGTEHNRRHAITFAFCHTLKPCALGDEAIRVAECESHLWPWARNGQYLGMFQMGSYARGRFGFSWSPWAQARQAYGYWLVSGWSPWECA